jgi:hypothetical protein
MAARIRHISFTGDGFASFIHMCIHLFSHVFILTLARGNRPVFAWDKKNMHIFEIDMRMDNLITCIIAKFTCTRFQIHLYQNSGIFVPNEKHLTCA